jgi:hypothetical protein
LIDSELGDGFLQEALDFLELDIQNEDTEKVSLMLLKGRALALVLFPLLWQIALR